MRLILYFVCIVFFITGCKESEPEIQVPIHFPIESLTDDLPFEQFNNFTKAIFTNSSGLEATYSISIQEEVVSKQYLDFKYTYNKTNFSYDIDFSFLMPSLLISTSLDYLNEMKKNEVIYCGSRIVPASAPSVHLTILPGTEYINTILNDEFEWMGTTFKNVYSNSLIDENSFNEVRIFYNSEIGIIGFTDFNNSDWIFDRYE